MNRLRITGSLLAALAMIAVCWLWVGRSAPPSRDVAREQPTADMDAFEKPTPDQLRKRLTPEQYSVTQQCGTEPPFRNAFWDNHRPGLYVDVVSGEPLFSSLDKFDSGTGWPSFRQPIQEANIVERADDSAGMERIEVRSRSADSHLGHVFDDGPGPNGLRYCINSAALRFVPVEEMESAGYGRWLGPFVKAGLAKETTREVAILAGGCFWGMEEILRKIPGVVNTTVGYCGGAATSATYDQVSSGETGHAEAVRVEFDPTRLRYEALLGYFFRMHDPTTLNQQHNDVGTQYRSVIFYLTEAQRQIAERVRQEQDRSGRFKRSVVTQLERAGEFFPAEEYHQKYLVKNPGGYNCHVLRPE